MSVCSSLTQGFLAFGSQDLIANGFVPEKIISEEEQEIRLLPASRINVELQYSVQSGITGTSLATIGGGGGALAALGFLGAGAGAAGAAIAACSLQGDFEPTISKFIFHVAGSNTIINRSITVTQSLIDQAEESDDGTVVFDFIDEYFIGVLGVTKDPIEFSEEEIENIGSGRSNSRSLPIQPTGQIRANFRNFNNNAKTNLFVEIKRDKRKLVYRGDITPTLNNKDLDIKSDVNVFLNSTEDDLVDSKIRFKLPGFGSEDDSDSKIEIGDQVFVTYVAADTRVVRQALEITSNFFLFPGPQVERISGEKVKAWNFLPFVFPARKSQDQPIVDYKDKATIADIIHDENVQNNDELSQAEKEEQFLLSDCESMRMVEVLFENQTELPFIKGVYFADSRGIVRWNVRDVVNPTKVMINASDIRDQDWWNNFINSFVGFTPGFDIDGTIPDPRESSRFFEGMLFDVSEHNNTLVYDDEKYGYQKDLALALQSVSKFDPADSSTGVGIPNLDIERLALQGRDRYDLSSVVFKEINMSSKNGGAYFVRDCNKLFVPNQTCTNGTIQADMFARTPFFFEDIPKNGRIYLERFTPQSPLERDGGIWITTRPSLISDSLSVDHDPIKHDAFVIFVADGTLRYIRQKDPNTILQTSGLTNDIQDENLNHSSRDINTFLNNNNTTLGLNKVAGSQPSYSNGIEIVTETGRVEKGEIKPEDAYDIVEAGPGRSVTFSHNKDDGQILVNGLDRRRMAFIRMSYIINKDFASAKDFSFNIIFPNSQQVISNIHLSCAGQTLNTETSASVHTAYYSDDSIEIRGDILKYIDITSLQFKFIKEEIYDSHKIETGNASVCIDGSGVIYVFYEDQNASRGNFGNQSINVPNTTLLEGSNQDISMAVSFDFGRHWYDFKGVVFTAANESPSSPYALADRISNKIHLFYVTNNSLLHKSFNANQIIGSDAYKAWKRPSRYTDEIPDDFALEQFTKQGRSLRRSVSNIVIGETESENSFLKNQLQICKSRREKELTCRFALTGDGKNFKEGFLSNDFVVHLDASGSFRVFYIFQGKVNCRISGSDGKDWYDLFTTDEAPFFHQNNFLQEPRKINNLGILPNEDDDSFLISYISDGMLFVRSFDTESFHDKEDALRSMDIEKPTSASPIFITGNLSQSIVDGLRKANGVSGTKVRFPYKMSAIPTFNENMSVSSVGLRGYYGKGGLARLFYQDINKITRAATFSPDRIKLDVKFKNS